MSTTARALRWGGMLPFVLLATRGAPLTAIAIPFILLPTALAARWRNLLPSGLQANIDTLTYLYMGGGTIGVIASGLLQGIISYALAFPLFRSETNRLFTEFTRTNREGLSAADRSWRLEMSRSWRYHVFVTCMSYVAAAGTEEVLKYLPVAFLREHSPTNKLSKAQLAQIYMQYAGALSLGFSTVENLFFSKASVKAGERGAKLALTIFERVAAGGLGHTIPACLTAINVAAQDRDRTDVASLWRIIGLPVLCHGTCDVICFGLSAWNGNIGWVHPENAAQTGFLMVLIENIHVGLFLYARQAWQALLL